MKQNIIIFSSGESLKIAKRMQSSFYHKDYNVTLWSQGFFEFSKSYISNFDNMHYEYDYAIAICNKDDITVKRDTTYNTTRDNVILELGMCIGTFGLERVLIVKEESVELPSDLKGIQPIDFVLETVKIRKC